MREAILSHPLFAGMFTGVGMILYNCVRAVWKRDVDELRRVWFWAVYIPILWAIYFIWYHVDFCIVIK